MVKNKLKREQLWLLIGIILSSSIGMAIGYVTVLTTDTIEKPYILPISFTYISNSFVLIYSILRIFGIVNPTQKTWRIIQLVSTIMLSVTMFVYWILLAKNRDWSNPYSDIGTILVHLLAPTLNIALFFLDLKNENEYQLQYKDMLYSLIFPLIFITYQQILWYTMKEPIYTILDIDKHGFLTPYLSILGMGLSIFAISWLLIFITKKINNKKLKNNE